MTRGSMDTMFDDAHALLYGGAFIFGQFELNRTTRELMSNGKLVVLGSRAMDILLALTERAGAIVSNRELHRRVWPHMVVGDGAIRVHVMQLRKVLRDADPDVDYVHNIMGRGYCFVAPVMSRDPPKRAAAVPSGHAKVQKLPLQRLQRRNNLPPLLTSVFGREQARCQLTALMARESFVTVTGPGGVGKTTAAIHAAGSRAAAYPHGIHFLDLGLASRPQDIWSMLAASLEMSPASDDPLPEILARLSKQSTLLLLDNCEHVIDTATRLAEGVLRSCSQVSIVATSREPLRASTEVVHELAPLALPVASNESSCESMMDYAAIRLFVERAAAHTDNDFDADSLSLVANICRRVGGNPLAIEIAAKQTRWLGLKSLAAGLQDEMFLSMEGRRMAEHRHQTLRASFDWSYRLLSHDEQAVFRRLSVFAGSFNSEHAATIVSDERLSRRIMLECLISLARKSLVAVDTSGHDVFYRLHDLPRAYAREKLRESQDLSLTHRRHSQMWHRAGFEQIHAHARLWRMAQRSAGAYLT